MKGIYIYDKHHKLLSYFAPWHFGLPVFMQKFFAMWNILHNRHQIYYPCVYGYEGFVCSFDLMINCIFLNLLF